jgi:hypothetical protein
MQHFYCVFYTFFLNVLLSSYLQMFYENSKLLQKTEKYHYYYDNAWSSWS